MTQLGFPLWCPTPSFSFKPQPFSSNECFSLVLTGRSMGAGLALLPEDLGGGGDSQRRKKRLSSRGFERLSSTQVRVPLSSSLLSSVQLEMKEATLCFFSFDIFLCCTLFLIRCYPQESNPVLSILISFSLGLLLVLFLLCVWANESPLPLTFWCFCGCCDRECNWLSLALSSLCCSR